MISQRRAWLIRASIASVTLILYLRSFPNLVRGLLHAEAPLPQVESLHQSWGALQFNKSTSETPLFINGVRYWSGLGTHASSAIKVTVPAGATTFSGACGLDDYAAGRGQFSCTIEVNKKEVWNSGVINKTNPLQSFSIYTTDSDSLLLMVQAHPQGIDFAHANWVDLRFDTRMKN